MTSEGSNGDDPRDTKVERDHPQTRKAEPDARGSSEWRSDVEPPPGDEQGAKHRDKPVWAPDGEDLPETGEKRDEHELDGPVGEMAEEAEAVRRQAVGAQTVGNALGSSAGRDVGSGTEPDRGGLGGGKPKAEEGTSTPAGTRSPGGDTRE